MSIIKDKNGIQYEAVNEEDDSCKGCAFMKDLNYKETQCPISMAQIASCVKNKTIYKKL